MLNIYLFKDELNNKMKRNLIDTYEEKYYILQKNWMKKLKTVLEYDKFFSYLELEKIKIKIKDIIDKYKQKNNYNEFISEIMNLISDSYKNEVNAKLKNEENFKELKNVEHYRVELKEKKNLSYYYGGIEIINDKIENLIQNLFNIENKEKMIFLFGDNKIIMNLDLTSQYSIILGDYIIDYFETSLLLQFNNKEYLDNYLKKFVAKGYDKTLENFTFELQNEIHIKDENSILIGKVYKINELENNITTNQNNDTPGNAQNNINNSISNINSNNNSTKNQTKLVISRIKLDSFMKNQIKALISFYLFSENLKQNIKVPRANTECYLIDENWMKNYTNFFLYDEVIQQIKNILNNPNNETIVEKIYEQFDIEFLKKIEEKEKQGIKAITHSLSSFTKENFIESANIKDIEKYYNFKFNIINEKTYEYMNTGSYIILKDVKKKEYLINDCRLFFKIYDNLVNKFEILICSNNSENNYLIPELLMKFKSYVIMNDNFEYLKKNNYIKFRNEKISQNGIELINKNNNETIGQIYNLKNHNILAQINNNPEINLKSSNIDNNIDDNDPNKLKEGDIIVNKNISISNSFNESETINKLRGQRPNEQQPNLNVNKSVSETNLIMEKKKSENFVLDETRKYHVEFVLRLICFEDKLFAKIKNSPQININNIIIENGYIINHKIIDCYKEFYNAKYLRKLLYQNNDLHSIFKKYRNNYNYISENYINNFSKEALEHLPKEYTKGIQEKNNLGFLSQLENKELYRATIKNHLDQQYYYYFEDCILINESLGKHLLSKIGNQHISNKFQPVKFMIAQGKLFINHNLNIYYGNINEKIIYIPEIMFCCSSQDELSKFIYELKATQINNILQQTKRKDNNISDVRIYKDTNIKIIILKGNYIINKKEESQRSDQNGQGKIPFFPPGGVQKNNNFSQQNNNMNLIGNNNMNGMIGLNNNNQNGNWNGQNNQINQQIQNNMIRKEVENLIYIIIDIKNIIKKLKYPLKRDKKDNKYEKYYPINFQWFWKYMEHYKLYNLYKNKNINQFLDYIINNNNQIYLSSVDIFLNAKQQPQFLNIINNFSKGITEGNYFNNQTSPTKININDIFYYSDFILLSEETFKSLGINNNIPNKPLFFYCYFGENKIFIVNNGPNIFLIEVYYLDNNNNILPEIFYKFNNGDLLSNCLSLLLEKGYYELTKYHLMFSDDKNNTDLTSPIFSQNNKEIGYAFKYAPNIKDYTPYIINKEYKTMVKLYFHYLKFHSKSIKHNNGKHYLLINSQYTKIYKDHYDYSILEQELSKNKIVLQAVQNIKANYEYVVDDKMMTLIIKNLPTDFNKKFHDKSKFPVQTGNFTEEPNIKYVQNTNLLYYDDFELISSELYSLLFKKNNLALYGTCYFINNTICIKMSKDLNKESNSAIFIYGCLHSHHNFKANYLLEFNNENDFIKNFDGLNAKGGFDKHINSIFFTNNNIEQLTDINNKPIGLIYNLDMKINHNPPIPPKPQPRPNSDQIPPPSNLLPLVGLKNVGATCYMNATLQCLGQIQELVFSFKNIPQVYKVYNTIKIYKRKNKDCLTESFKTLIDNLWPDNFNNLSKNSNNYYYAPNDFKNKISKMNPLFQGVQANDAKDLVNFIIMTLHDELNEKQKQNININIQGNQSNEQYMLQCFMNLFCAENQSIISNIFYGVTHTMTKCSNCPFYKHNFEAYFFLIFPLEEVRKYKLQELINRNNQINQNMMNPGMMMNMNMNMGQNMMNMMQMNPQEFQNNLNKIQLLQNNSVDIYDCFDYNQKIENFVGENAMYCDTCRRQLPASFQTRLYNAPEVLILVLNRGAGIQFKVKLQFNLQLNLYNYLDNKTSSCIYDLIGVVTHMGESGASGHFIATCRSPKDNYWYQFNDDLVFPVTDFNQQILNYAMPYILFYKKNHINNNMNNMNNINNMMHQ